ncbi:MAG: hypothetical protein A4E57_04842 [Syntrophorhabdaceae bacterium PtaU1.Bin034]|jgi:uncharacterized repeat protein (TIGR03943 family)|nr:MAG: hypothetical protein A4E57_04842 [Syntrophorhabdaceae bacterium PtaU1.Bin034]
MDHAREAVSKKFISVRIMTAIVLASWSACLFFLLNGQRYTSFLRPGFGVFLAVGLAGLLLLWWGIFQANEGQNLSVLTTFLRTGILLVPLVYIIMAHNGVLDEYAFEKRLVMRPEADRTTVEKAQGVVDDDKLIRNYAAHPPRMPDAGLRSVGITPPGKANKALKQNKNKVIEVKLNDLTEHGDLLEGKRVSTEGMVAFLEGIGPNRFYVFRFLIWCCTSDALPIPVLVEYDRAADLTSNSWVRVVATPRIIEGDYGKEVVLKDAKVEVTKRPKDPYLY